ncbi:zinc finger, CCHC-type containing protein [Tanacetum coccineum]
MAATPQNTNNTTIRSILLAEKLICSNFTNSYRNLRIILRYEKKMKSVEQPAGPPDPKTADLDTIEKYYESVNLEQEVACLIMLSMSPDLQRTLEKYNTYDMLKELKTIFEEQAKQELFEQSSNLPTFKLEGRTMINTVQNYNMHNMGKTIAELHAMLKLHEKGISKKAETPAMLAIHEGKIQKDRKKLQGAKGKEKGKNKLAYAPKPKIPPPPKREHPTKVFVCHHYKEVGHSKRNCPSYQAELKKRKSSCIDSTSESRKLKHGALSLYMGNGMRAPVEAIGNFDLILPSGLIIVLDNCHFAPFVTRGVVSTSCLVNKGYIPTFTNMAFSKFE